MNKMTTVLAFALVLVAGCNTSPEGPTYGTDSGVTPAGDSGSVAVVDAGVRPTEWRSCGGPGAISPTRFRIRVLDAADGPLGACAAGWDPIAYALPISGDVHVVGSDIDQLVRPEWVGTEVDFNFICGSDGRYATVPAGSNPSDCRVSVEVSYDGISFEDVSSIVDTAVSPSGGTLFRLPLCSTYL
ncbi:hypothetical protein K8R04_04850 [Candidatus Uhrbacteria bacterium]|nr:hypothetical protein [Candidatus Uhrbacteria bacterium]